MPETGFINVDLEVGARSRAALTPLLTALEGRLLELYRGRIGRLYRGHFETHDCAREVNATIHALADVLESLPPGARRAWKAASMRDFNVGVDLARGVKNVELAIEHDAVQRVAALGARLAFTAYQASEMERKPRIRR